MNRLTSENKRRQTRRKAEDRIIAGAYLAILAYAFAESIPQAIVILAYIASLMFALSGIYYIIKYFDY